MQERSVDILKASGDREAFDREKFRRSLSGAGIEDRIIRKVSGAVERKLYPGISSAKVFGHAVRALRGEDPMLAARYNLKRAIMELGPSGFPFERYVAEILRAYGYSTKVDQQVAGYCVVHEVDVVAEKDGKTVLVEAKYHNRPGTRSDVKVALYTYARFLDIQRAREARKTTPQLLGAMLVTNTKCTSEAIRYAECQGLEILSWGYPRGRGLEALIRERHLYPVTILPSCGRYAREQFAREGIITTQDMIARSPADLSHVANVSYRKAQRLWNEAQLLRS